MLEHRVSLCDRCENNDCIFTRDVIKPALKDAGVEFKSIWCKETDRPENERWYACPGFKERT